MDNQQEIILYKSSETIHEAPLKIVKGWRYSPTLFEKLGI